jgi:hypothetical protein
MDPMLPKAMHFCVSDLGESAKLCDKKGWPEPYIYGVYTVFLAGKSQNIRSYTVHIYNPGQP